MHSFFRLFPMIVGSALVAQMAQANFAQDIMNNYRQFSAPGVEINVVVDPNTLEEDSDMKFLEELPNEATDTRRERRYYPQYQVSTDVPDKYKKWAASTELFRWVDFGYTMLKDEPTPADVDGGIESFKVAKIQEDLRNLWGAAGYERFTEFYEKFKVIDVRHYSIDTEDVNQFCMAIHFERQDSILDNLGTVNFNGIDLGWGEMNLGHYELGVPHAIGSFKMAYCGNQSYDPENNQMNFEITKWAYESSLVKHSLSMEEYDVYFDGKVDYVFDPSDAIEATNLISATLRLVFGVDENRKLLYEEFVGNLGGTIEPIP